MRPFVLAALTGLLTLGSACATLMYPGPKRGDHETAILLPGMNTTVLSVDGRDTPGGAVSRYEILAGKREILAIAVSDSGRIATTVAPASVCFSARPAHVYEIRASLVRTEIGDVLTKSVLVDVKSGEDAKEICSDDPVAAHVAAEANAGPSTMAMPTTGTRTRPRVHNTDVREPPLATGLQLGFGLAFGGDRLATITYTNGRTEDMNAGDGASASLGGTFTPIWIAGSVGLGMGGSLGLKYASIGASDGGISFMRYPLDLWIQSLFRLSDTWYLKVAGGAHKDYGAHISGSGLAESIQADLQSPFGWMAEVGPYWLSSWHWALSISARLTSVRYTTELGAADGTNVSLEAAFHFNL